MSQNGKRITQKDPMLLLSVVNTKLRDYYHSLDALCDDMNVNKEEIINALKPLIMHMIQTYSNLSRLPYILQKKAVVFTFCERLIMNNTKEQRECLIL